MLIPLGLALVACAGDNGGGETRSFTVPSSYRFDVVSRTLDAHCGTLDCHGSSTRNLRLRGWSGRRLDASHVPGGAPTTPLETGANYCAVTALEPEILERVARENGADPERLTLLRKVRGKEAHQGGKVFAPGSAGDACLLAWLAGNPEEMLRRCEESLDTLPDPPPAVAPGVDLSACAAASEVEP
jgi:hypothetical protein